MESNKLRPEITPDSNKINISIKKEPQILVFEN
jgi:hypothetical protein